MLVMIFMTIILPLLGLLFLVHKIGWRFKNPEGRKKLIPYLIATFLVGAISTGLMYAGGTAKQHFNEVWNYKGEEVRFYEYWDEEVSCAHPIYRRVPSGTDSKGNATYTDVYVGDEHPYDVDRHPEHWIVVNEYGSHERISKSTYNRWVGIFGHGPIFRDMHRDYHSVDGNMFFSTWDKTHDKMMPLSAIKKYKNKVRVSNSVFAFAEPTEAQLAKFPRPADKNNVEALISYGPPTTREEALALRRTNAKNGRTAQIHAMILLFDEDRDIVDEVLAAWKGVNKNELAIFVGVSGENRDIQWCDIHSWVDDTTIHATIANEIIAMKQFDGFEVAKIIDENVGLWKRKEFADFEYLKVPISVGWFLGHFFILIAVIIITPIIIQKNSSRSRYSRSRWT